MRITITIERGELYGENSKVGRKLKAIFKKLINTAFPVGVMHSKVGERQDILHFTGSVEDFIDAVNIKDKWVKGGRTTEGKKRKNDKLRPIYQKSKVESVDAN